MESDQASQQIAKLTNAIAHGDTSAMFDLALRYSNEELGEPNIAAAKALLEQAADLGHSDSMYFLALMYRDGVLGEPNMEAAKALLGQAAALNHPDSMHLLAAMHLDGISGEPDVEAAKNLLEPAIALNHPESMYLLALMYRNGELGEPNMEAAKDLLQQSVALNYPESMYLLALMYRDGELGEPNMEAAKDLLKKSTALNHSESMYLLALMYKNGELGEPDMEAAKSLLDKAVTLNHPEAMRALALMYRDGDFGIPNIKEAKALLEKSINLKHPSSMYSLALLHLQGKMDEPNIDKAKALLEQAAAFDHSKAIFCLGIMYQTDLLGKPDYKKADLLFKRAMDLGLEEASTFLRNPMINELLETSEVKSLRQRQIVSIERALQSLEEAFFKLRREHLVTPPKKLAHFTSWSAIESILPISPPNIQHTNLRLYHVDYMNDPSEGRRLINFKPQKNLPRYKAAITTSTQLRTLFEEYYFKSFREHTSTAKLLPSIFTVSLTEESDRLDLWRAYGQDGLGYCLVLPFEEGRASELIFTERDRSTSREFISRNEIEHLDSKNSQPTPPALYQIYYSDKEVANTLNTLSPALKTIFDLREKLPSAVWEKVVSCSTAILLELLYLFKDEQYSTEKEVRALYAFRLNNQRIKMDERLPGRLYCESAPFLFQSKTSEIIIGPKVPTPAVALWNIRFRLSKLGLADNVVVRTSDVPYR